LFLAGANGQIMLLDPGGGDIEVVAESISAFRSLLVDPQHAPNLLQEPVVRAFEEQHGPMAAGHCLSYTQLPVLGGAYSSENRFTLSIGEHAAVTGEMHRQLRDLPDGAKVKVRIVP
jgi:hypothetical protein